MSLPYGIRAVPQWDLLMPKEKPVTQESSTHLLNTVHDGYSSLLIVRSILSGYFNRDEQLIYEIERLVKEYAKFQKQCENEFLKKTKH
jgi:hypothetical protein